MTKPTTALAFTAVLALSACLDATSDEVAGGLIGGAFGAITAAALDADTEWVIVGALAGATVGTLIARNQATQKCAYSYGDGTYYTAPCP